MWVAPSSQSSRSSSPPYHDSKVRFPPSGKPRCLHTLHLPNTHLYTSVSGFPNKTRPRTLLNQFTSLTLRHAQNLRSPFVKRITTQVWLFGPHRICVNLSPNESQHKFDSSVRTEFASTFRQTCLTQIHEKTYVGPAQILRQPQSFKPAQNLRQPLSWLRISVSCTHFSDSHPFAAIWHTLLTRSASVIGKCVSSNKLHTFWSKPQHRAQSNDLELHFDGCSDLGQLMTPEPFGSEVSRRRTTGTGGSGSTLHAYVQLTSSHFPLRQLSKTGTVRYLQSVSSQSSLHQTGTKWSQLTTSAQPR